MNKYLFIISIVLAIFLLSCEKQDEITGLSKTEGKFIVDSIGTVVCVKIDSTTGDQKTYLEFSLVYHFENYTGSLDRISLAMENSFGVITFFNHFAPSSINDFHRYKRVYNFPDSLVSRDSIKIFRELEGAFWTKSPDNVVNILGNYFWKDSLYVIVQR